MMASLILRLLSLVQKRSFRMRPGDYTFSEHRCSHKKPLLLAAKVVLSPRPSHCPVSDQLQLVKNWTVGRPGNGAIKIYINFLLN